jgi:hypothetical protein
MNMEDFSITTRMTGNEYSKATFIGLYRKPRIILAGIFGIVLIILGGLEKNSLYSYEPSVEITIGVYFLLVPTISVLRSVKYFRSTPGVRDEITYTFNQSGYIVQGHTIKAEIQWTRIIKREEIGKFLILYLSNRVGNFIDKTKLTSGQLEFIRSKVQYS